MAEKSLSFSPEMAAATYAGLKGQTRRLYKGPPKLAVGDVVWIREPWRTFASFDKVPPRDLWRPNGERGAGIRYEAGGGMYIADRGDRWLFDFAVWDIDGKPTAFGKYRASMHMCRHFSRMTIEITDVGVEALQAITDADAIDEGITGKPVVDLDPEGNWWSGAPRRRYAELFNRVNKDDLAWTRNPTVVVYRFNVRTESSREMPKGAK
jgi:hypothetical protein